MTDNLCSSMDFESSIEAAQQILNQPVFPLEIFQLILSDLASAKRELSIPALRACCLVSKAFVPLCRPFIFQGFIFGPVHAQNENQHRLQKFLRKNAHLARYFQDVTYSVNHSVMKAQNWEIQRILARQVTEFPVVGYSPVEAYVDRLLAGGDPTLARTLTNIKTLRIDHCDHGPSDMQPGIPWNDICDGSIIRVLKAHCSSDTLTTLHIDNTGALPMFIILNAPNLQELHMTDCECAPNGWNIPDENETLDILSTAMMVNAPRIKLKTLVIDYLRAFSPHILPYCTLLEHVDAQGINLVKPPIPDIVYNSASCVSFDFLHTLNISEPGIWAHMCALAEGSDKIAFPNLQELTVIHCPAVDIPALNVIFGHVPSLKSVSLKLSGYASLEPEASSIDIWKCFQNCSATLKHVAIDWTLVHKYDESIVQTLNEGLKGVLGSNVLERLDIKVILGETLNLRSAQFSVSPSFEHLETLSALLVQDKQRDFPMLCEVRVEIDRRYFFYTPEELEDMGSWLGDDFLFGPLQPLYIHAASEGIDFTSKHAILS